MNLQEIIGTLSLNILTQRKDFTEIVPTSAYASDMLSCVMTGCQSGGLWITLQSHMNIVGVAALVEASAIIITEGAMPDRNTIDKADQQGVILLATPSHTYAVCGRLWELGITK
jgi:predicted transcriptional regulator